jgi:hypothetical protein
MNDNLSNSGGIGRLPCTSCMSVRCHGPLMNLTTSSITCLDITTEVN